MTSQPPSNQVTEQLTRVQVQDRQAAGVPRLQKGFFSQLAQQPHIAMKMSQAVQNMANRKPQYSSRSPAAPIQRNIDQDSEQMMQNHAPVNLNLATDSFKQLPQQTEVYTQERPVSTNNNKAQSKASNTSRSKSPALARQARKPNGQSARNSNNSREFKQSQTSRLLMQNRSRGKDVTLKSEIDSSSFPRYILDTLMSQEPNNDLSHLQSSSKIELEADSLDLSHKQIADKGHSH